MPKTLNVRPRSQRLRDDDSTDDPYSDELEGSSPSVMVDGEDVQLSDDGSEDGESSKGDDSNVSDNEEDTDDSDADLESASEAEDEDVQTKLNKVSFGDLAKAQSQMSKTTSGNKKRKRGADTSADTEGKLQALRERLRELREAKGIPSNKSAENTAKVQYDSDDATSGSEEDDSDAPEQISTKRSKHGPMTAPSNKAVSRKRTVVASNKPASARVRDPRFAPLSGAAPSDEQLAKNYAFLDEYRQSEIAELKDKLGETKKGKSKQSVQSKKKGNKFSEEDKMRMKKELTRMESQEQSRREKQRLEEVSRKHKREEQEKVAQGKNPFFLKKSEQKRLAIVDKFEGMKSKQRDKVLDRRRKKIAAKERKSMPAARRGAVE